MNTYNYMYDVLGLRGIIDISFQQLIKLRDEGITFYGGYRCDDREGLILECTEAMRLEYQISEVVHHGARDVKQVMNVTNIWAWKYLQKEYSIDSKDGGIHFSNLIIYCKEEEEDDN